MPKYLISFDDGAMSFPDEELPAVAAAARAVVRAAMDAGVWVFGGGLADRSVTVVAVDGTVTAGAYPADRACLGGFSILDLPSFEDARTWAARIAVACRCAQDVREIMPSPEI